MSERFILAVHSKAIVRTQGAVELNRWCEPQPDLAVLKFREDGYSKANPLPADILLVIEVADSSAQYDFDTKLKLYARYGIPEVWVFDVRQATLHFFRSRRDFGYAEESSTRAPGVLPLPSLQLTVDLAGLVRG